MVNDYYPPDKTRGGILMAHRKNPHRHWKKEELISLNVMLKEIEKKG